jgi:glutamine synthetase
VPQVSMIILISKSPMPTANNVEIWYLRRDWSSIRCCGFKLNHASIMCFLVRKEAEDIFDQCPRMLLSCGLEQLAIEWDTKVMAGFEIEVMLLDKDYQPFNNSGPLNSYQTTAGLRGMKLEIVEEVLDTFKVSSIKLHHFHTETPDQITFALSLESLLDAVDSLVLAQETIRTISVKYNIKATMTPKPVLNGLTSRIHFHMSVDKLQPPFTDNFLAGILTHMDSLCAFGMANFDSYARTIVDTAGTWVGFGTENRDLPVCKITKQQ